MSTDRKRQDFVIHSPSELIPISRALKQVESAMAKWELASQDESRRVFNILAQEYPDHHAPKDFWMSASSKAFFNFFVWGHNHNFGHGYKRDGAMGSRHIEIASELISLGMMPNDLTGLKVLDIGCWSGGDLLILAGLGAHVEAIEEHPLAASTAKRLVQLVGCNTLIHSFSAYNDRPEWKHSFDMVYCSGVIYHVTDPLLLLRICFAYLKPGGRLVIETKMHMGSGPSCSYSGIVEKGWNWYAPTLETMGRWLVDAGFSCETISLHRRSVGRILASCIKNKMTALPEIAGFSRPGSWLEEVL